MAEKQLNLAAFDRIDKYEYEYEFQIYWCFMVEYAYVYVFVCAGGYASQSQTRCWFGAIYSSVAAAKQPATIGRELWIFKLCRKNMIGVSFTNELQAKQMSENEVACRVGRQITISKEHLKLTSSHFFHTTWDFRDLLFLFSAFVKRVRVCVSVRACICMLFPRYFCSICFIFCRVFTFVKLFNDASERKMLIKKRLKKTKENKMTTRIIK